MNRVKRFVGFPGISGNDQYLWHFSVASLSSEGSGSARPNFEIGANFETQLEELRREAAGVDRLTPHDVRRTCAHLCHGIGGELKQILVFSGSHVRGKGLTARRMKAAPFFVRYDAYS
jgi:hypothetical protein